MRIKKKLYIFIFIFILCFLLMNFSYISADEYSDLDEINYFNYTYKYSDGYMISDNSKFNHYDEICLLSEDNNIFINTLDSFTTKFKNPLTGEISEGKKICCIRFIVIIKIKNITSNKMSVILTIQNNENGEWKNVGLKDFKVNKSGYYHVPIYYNFSSFKDISNKVRIQYESNDGYCIINRSVIATRYYQTNNNEYEKVEYLPIIKIDLFK